MDTEALIDRIRSLRDRIDVPASPVNQPISQPAPASRSNSIDAEEDIALEPITEVSPEDEQNTNLDVDTEFPNTDTLSDNNHNHKDRTASIASNLSVAMSSLNEDIYDVYANKSDVTAIENRMHSIEQKLHKTQDMIVTLNRAVGRLIDYEEKQTASKDTASLERNQQQETETHQISTPVTQRPSLVSTDSDTVMVLDKIAPDQIALDRALPSSQTMPDKKVKQKSYHSVWYAAAIIMLIVLYFVFASSSTTSQPASSLPDSDAFLNENEAAVFAHIEMGMARPLGITSLDVFSSRMWEKGVDLPQYYECLVSIMNASTKPMNQMMILELLDNPLRSDYNPAIVDRQRALFESRYGSADHYGGYARAETNIESCRNW